MIPKLKDLLTEAKYDSINQIQSAIRKALKKADIRVQPSAYNKTAIRGAPSRETGVTFMFKTDSVFGRDHEYFFKDPKNPNMPKGFYDYWGPKTNLEYYRGVWVEFYTRSRDLKQEKKMLKPIFAALKSAGFKPKRDGKYVFVSYDGLVDEMDRYKRMRS